VERTNAETPPPDNRRRDIGLRRRERTRQKLLDAAARVVADLGEEKATIDDFIQAAGVARGTLYNYYSTRAELLDDLWRSIGKNPFRRIHLACHQLTDPAERLATEARMVLKCAAASPAWGWLVFALSADAESINEDLLAYPRPDLEAGRRAGRFVFDDLASASDLVVGTVRTAIRATLSERRSENYEKSLISPRSGSAPRGR
jgi:AcrR family transcriptional regulator